LESLQNEKQRNVALMASSNDAIIGKDLGGNISSWNNGAQKIGYP